MMKPVVRLSDFSGAIPLFDVSMGAGATRGGLPSLTWSEMVALRDELNRFLSDSRNAEGSV